MSEERNPVRNEEVSDVHHDNIAEAKTPVRGADKNDWKDAFKIDRTMAKYKIFFICFVGAGTCIIAYLPLQMKQLGLSPIRIGLASAIRPLAAAISTTIIGAASCL